MKKQLSKIKTKIQEHKLELITAAVTAVPITIAYVVFLKKLAEQDQRFPKGDTTWLALNEESMTMMKDGNNPVWIINDHKINIAYDPDC